MNKVFWFFNENEAYYEDQCQKALAEGRIHEWHEDEVAFDDFMDYSRPYVVLTERDWNNLVYSANAQQMDIVNNPETNLPMLKEREPVDPTSRESLEQELSQIDSRLHELDYIGIKIATGRGTREEYASEIAEMQRLADRKNEILAELGSIPAKNKFKPLPEAKNSYISALEAINNKKFATRQEARDFVGYEYTEGNITQEDMNMLTARIDEVYGDTSYIQL